MSTPSPGRQDGQTGAFQSPQPFTGFNPARPPPGRPYNPAVGGSYQPPPPHQVPQLPRPSFPAEAQPPPPSMPGYAQSAASQHFQQPTMRTPIPYVSASQPPKTFGGPYASQPPPGAQPRRPQMPPPVSYMGNQPPSAGNVPLPYAGVQPTTPGLQAPLAGMQATLPPTASTAPAFRPVQFGYGGGPPPPQGQIPPPTVSSQPLPSYGSVPPQAPPSRLLSTQLPAPAPAPGHLSAPSASYGPSNPSVQPASYIGPQAPGFYPASAQPTAAPSSVGGYGSATKLVEEFESLSLMSAPGSLDARINPASLPRPADEEPTIPVSANCHPRYFRLTCNAVPNAHSLAARWHLPLGAVVDPLAEAPEGEEVPVVNFGTSGIVRCRRCRTYINPYAMFTDNGRHWRCNVCQLLNEVPMDYFCALDANGKRRDVNERPELSQGSVEFVAPAEYMVRPPMPPVYFFLIDVSVASVKSGMLQVAVDTIKSCLDELPGSPRTQIGFLTFDSTLHFYNLKSSLTQPQMVVMAQLDDLFLPMPDDLLVNLTESRTVVEALLDNLPSTFADNTNIESALGPALQAVAMLMGQLGGKLLIFQSTLPSLGVGRLKLRGEDPRIYGTDKEYTIRVADEQFYKQMAADFSKYQIGVNTYAFSEKYTDLASLGTLSKYTGGQVCYYPGFQEASDGEKFRYELARDLKRETAWEAVMRIRCGKGIKYSSFHGHFMLRSSDLLSLPAVDCDKTFAVQFALEDTLLTSQTVYFQVALLYTSSVGERRIRVHTLAAPVVSDLSEMYRAADAGAIVGVLSRLAIDKSLTTKLEDARQFLQTRLVNALREYRNLYAVKHQLMGRLVYPESLKLLPLYILCLCKSLALRGGFLDAHPDERSVAGYEIMTMSCSRLLKLIYPSLFRVDEFLLQGDKSEPGDLVYPPQHPLSMEVLDPRGAFLLYDGFRFVLWLGNLLQTDFVIRLLGQEVASSADLRKVVVVEQNTELSRRFHRLLDKLRKGIPACYQQLFVVRRGEQPRENNLLLANLSEDRNVGLLGYADWMVHLHRQVQQKI